MIIKAGHQEIMEPNATVRMIDGDHLSIAYTDIEGRTYLVTLEARAVALAIKESRTGDMLFIQQPKYGNILLRG